MDRSWIYAGLAAAVGVGLVRALRPPRLRAGVTRMMIIGDSLAVGLSPLLKSMAAEQKIAVDAFPIISTRIDQWAKSAVLGEHLASFKPTLVLISLGTNDEYIAGDAVSRQRPFLEQLLARFPDSEVVWIGPPTLPKTTNGITPMLQARVPSAQYFPSQTLTISRGPDGIHPTAKGYAGWAGAIWQWLS